MTLFTLFIPFFIFCFNSCFISICAASSSGVLHVIIDAGHGGSDSGAVRGHTREADLTMKVAKFLAHRLKKDKKNFKVTLTRYRDKFLSMQKRAKIAIAVKSEVFISLHVNTAPDKRARGVEFFFQNQLPADEETMYLASIENKSREALESPLLAKPHHPHPEVAGIIEDLHKTYRVTRSWQLAAMMQKHWSINRSRVKSIRQAPFFLVSNVPMPSVLVELGFLSNERDIRTLKSQKHQRQMAFDLHKALLQFKVEIDRDLHRKMQLATSG